MRTQIIILALLVLFNVGSAGTYQLGSHNVSLNLSVSAVYSIETPAYQSKVEAWWYTLNITPAEGGLAKIHIQENTYPMYSSTLVQDFAADTYQNKKDEGIGGYQYNIINYKGYAAAISYTPAQRLFQNGEFVLDIPEYFSLIYQQDEKTIVTVEARDISKSLFENLLGSMEIMDSTNKTKIQDKPYIGSTSSWAIPEKESTFYIKNENSSDTITQNRGT